MVVQNDQDSNSPNVPIDLGVKFTRSMSELLLFLLFYCLLSNDWSPSRLNSLLASSFGRTPKTIGSSLRMLSDLSLLSYSSAGQGKSLSPSLSHEFIQSLLLRSFGFFPPKNLDSFDFSSFDFPSHGFLPANLNFSDAISFFSRYESFLDFELDQYRSWLDWIDFWSDWSSDASSIDFNYPDSNNFLVAFAETLFSRFDALTQISVNPPNGPQLAEIISKTLSEQRIHPPWLLEFDPRFESMRVDKEVL